ncbi:carbohydrate-binding family 9-like protein [Muriicola sp. Z0-33]|uniref:carbohydrate-binding family 9-like protein n=1 Tax=Muriicola sp. Z0-33 TaxID=2816957 RepID=UPI0022377263|nr:carbohydrate-binding family 9-like protein [Muriicola sp. Z0-33]MCW5516488.1 hypothetical protein [Muriicola sp. Z0-33]
MNGKTITILFLGVLFLGCIQENNTKVLVVKEIEYQGSADIEKAAQLLEQQTELHKINTLNWEAFPYLPDVAFRIGHHNNEIWIKYYIDEAHVLARRTETNSATHKDSCLEFFLDPKGDGNYYNFEVNAIGTVHLAYGPGIGKRTFIDPSLIKEKIRVESSLGDTPFDELPGVRKWEMTLIIPSEILVYDSGIQFSQLQSRANFFKCGDESAVPHYLSWNSIATDRPNFHTPQFFGRILFE